MSRICLLCRTEYNGDEVACPNDGTDLHEVLTNTNFDVDQVEGKVLDGRYILEKLVGAGGMGTVFRARHAFLDRTVAVKILHPELLAISDVRARFLREARSASAIDHERVVNVLDFGVTPAHLCFLVMEHLYGRDLAEHLEPSAKLEVEDVLEIGIQVCEALSAIHNMGFVHRDLKPENIWLGGDSVTPFDVKLLDFGVVGLVEGSLSASTRLTQIGRTIGTPQYMSPEQCKGEEVDGRSDLYGLGCILWELIAGEAAFQGKAPLDVLTKHLIHTPPPVSTMAKEVPPGLDAVIAHCLEKDRSRRWEGASQLASALRALASSLARGQRLDQTEPEADFAWAATLEPMPDTDVEHLIEGRYVVTGDLADRRATRIYRGKRLSDELSIAIKLYGRAHRHASSEDARKRFLALAGRAVRFEHPNLVRVFDYGVIGNGSRPFLVMELLNGSNLATHIEKRGPLTARRAIQLFEEVLAALAVGHREDLVHGDLKPSSLVLVDEGTRNERLCALDYLIATPPRDLLAENRITGSDQLSSGRYLPPEYVNEQEVGPALDVYQAGLVLAECLTGTPLITGDSVMQCIAKCSVGDLELDDRLLDSPLGPIIRKALAFESENRYADAGEFADALSGLPSKDINLIEACLSRPRKRRVAPAKRNSIGGLTGNDAKGALDRSVNRPSALDTDNRSPRFRPSTTDVEQIGSLASGYVEGEDDTDSEHVSSQEDDLFSLEDLTSAEDAPPQTMTSPQTAVAGTRPMSMMEIAELVHPKPATALTGEVVFDGRRRKTLVVAGLAVAVTVALLFIFGVQNDTKTQTVPTKHSFGTSSDSSPSSIDGGVKAATGAKPKTAASKDAGAPRPPSRSSKIIAPDRPARKPAKSRRRRKSRRTTFEIR